MFGRKLLAGLGAVVLASSVHAFSLKPQAAECPNTADIQAQGLSMAIEIMPEFFMATHMDKYNTDRDWAFAIFPIEAFDEGDALEQANNELASLIGPVDSGEQDGVTACLYAVDNPEHMAMAVELDGIGMLSKIKQKARSMIKRK